VDVGLLGVKRGSLVTGKFDARGVVDPTIAKLDTLAVVEVVGLVLLDGEDVLLEEDDADEAVDEGVEEVEEVLDVVVSEDLGVEVDSAGDEEEWVDSEAGFEDVEDETGVALGDFGVTEGACESEGVGEEAELGVKEGVLALILWMARRW
jgi:hypothetical protein